jgi:hypothetical protein
MNYWLFGIIAYALLTLGTLAPILSAVIKGIELHPGGSSVQESTRFSEEAKTRLTQHYSRIGGTLSFWKKQATIYKRLHYYCLCWTIPSSVIIPFLAQAMTSDPYSKWLITVVSGYTAILLAFHKALKVDGNYKAFRQGESEFYDLHRRLLDRPTTFGAHEEEQLANYFDAVENVRKYIRNAEIDNLPTIEQVKTQLAGEQLPPSQ